MGKQNNSGINNKSVRKENLRNVARLLYREEALTKQEISSKLNISFPTVQSLLADLVKDGLVIMQSSNSSRGGRIPEVAKFVYNDQYAFGLEITEHHLRINLVDLRGRRIYSEWKNLLFRNELSYWREIRDVVYACMEKHALNTSKILGVGIAIPGVVVHSEHLVDYAPTLGLKHFDYGGIEALFDFPVIFENEANAAGFAEVWLHPSNFSDAIYLSINKGVGGAVINGQTISAGINNRCGEFGHMTLVPNGIPCSCGKRGCFEAYSSTRNLTDPVKSDDLNDFFQKKTNDPGLEKIWSEYMNYLALAISNICISWDLPIIVGGSISPFLENDFQQLIQNIESMIPFEKKNTFISLSKNGVDVSSIGAAMMVVAERLKLLDI